MKHAAIIVIFPSIDARAAHDMSDAKVFLGFSGVNRLNLVNYETKLPFGAILFFNKEDFREATDSIERVLRLENNRGNTSRCYGAVKIEVHAPVMWHDAEDFLAQNDA